MVLELAVASVEKKLDMRASILVGNYEFYYAAGKLATLVKLDANEKTQPAELKDAVMQALENYKPEEADRGSYLKKMLDRYRPSASYDEQMAILFCRGQEGKDPTH